MSQNSSAGLESDSMALAHDQENRETTTAPASFSSLESPHALLLLSPGVSLDSPSPPQHISHDINNGVLPVNGATSSSAHDQSSHNPAYRDDHDQVEPPSSVIPPTCDLSTPPIDSYTKPKSTTTTQIDSQSATENNSHKQSAYSVPATTHLGDAATAETNEGRMIYGAQNPAHVLQRRRNYANTNAVTDYEADLTSKDRAKQKEAVKRYLMDRVRQDWTWDWPRPEPRSDESSPERAPGQIDEALSQGQWKERDEWLSNASESDGESTIPGTTSSPDTPSPTSKSSPFRFDSPDGVGITIQKTQLEKKRRRKKRLTEEVSWNDGMRCFVARRDAWTGARRVSRSTLGIAGAKDGQAKHSQRPSTSSGDGGSSTAIDHENEEEEEWEDEIEIPVAPALIPPANAMRASILPAAYGTIYDKVVAQSLTPSCPMNLKDITRSCVQGWKRDGEWPPKSSIVEPKAKGRKMSIASLFGVEKHDKEPRGPARASEKDNEKKGGTATGIRKGLQKILSMGHSTKEHSNTNGNEQVGKGKGADVVTHVS